MRQALRFGIVGAAATAVHAALYGVAAGRGLLGPLQANAAAFAAAFVVSFAGHRYWTFAGAGAGRMRSLARFLATALLGLASNSLIVWLLVEQMRLPPASALPGIVLVTPALVFALSRRWAFAAPQSIPGVAGPKSGISA